MALTLMPLQISWSLAKAAPGVNAWWPTDGAHLSGTQPFKAVLDGTPIEQYEMFWQVDGGGWVWMDNNYTDYPHKEAHVDVSSWTWRGSGPYKVNFIARQGGVVTSEKAVSIYIDNGQAVQQVPSSQPQEQTQVQAQPQPSTAPELKVASFTTTQSAPQKITNSSNPLSGLNFHVNKYSPAATQAALWRNSRPNDAQKMDILASTPSATWLGGWSGDVQQTVSKIVNSAQSQEQTPVLVAYNIPQRDCGGYSAGGTSDYLGWIGAVSRGIGSSPAVVILEPDALAGITCLSQSDQQKRLELLASATSILKSNAATRVYIDAGHSGWIEPSVMASRLQAANIAKADGFATNVSNFVSTDTEVNYGSQVSQKLGGKHFVIDTSRNGNGSNGEWCNPWGRAVGYKSTTNTGNALVDAYLWLKAPGESDGNCNGGPSAGVWWPDYALHLVR
jgi:endoglucanase